MTAAVFHAPIFALNADADWNACEPNHKRLRAEPHAVHADGKGLHGSARLRVRPNPHARARAHTCPKAARGRV